MSYAMCGRKLNRQYSCVLMFTIMFLCFFGNYIVTQPVIIILITERLSYSCFIVVFIVLSTFYAD